MARANKTPMARANETLSHCLNYAIGYLDALAGNAIDDDARTSAREAAQAIRDMMVPRPPEWREQEDRREQEEREDPE